MMFYIPCESCGEARWCGQQADLIRRIFFAKGQGVECAEFREEEPRWFKGIEGVTEESGTRRPARHNRRGSIIFNKARKGGLGA